MSRTEPEKPAQPGSRGMFYLAWALVLGLLIWIYTPHIVSMVASWWDDPNYSHGFLVPIVAAGLIWRQRKQLSDLAAGPEYWGLAVIGLSLAVLVVGQMAHEFYLRRLSLIPVMWGLVLLAWGWPVARRLWFAFVYLVLMVPLPYMLYDAVAFPLRLIAAQIAAWVIRLMGVPVYLEGNVLHLPNVVLNVVDACSGIRSLISLLAVGVILAYLILPNRWIKFVVVLLVVPVAVMSNAIRVAVAGLAAEWIGPETLEGVMHDAVGWVVFMIGFLILLGITVGLEKIVPQRSDES